MSFVDWPELPEEAKHKKSRDSPETDLAIHNNGSSELEEWNVGSHLYNSKVGEPLFDTIRAVSEDILDALKEAEGNVMTTTEIYEEIGLDPNIISAALRMLKEGGNVNSRESGGAVIWWLDPSGNDDRENIPEDLEEALGKVKRPTESVEGALSRNRGCPSSELLELVFSEETESSEDFREAVERHRERSDRSDLRKRFE